MHELTTSTLRYKGTPEGARRVGFHKPSGETQACIVQGVDDGWDHSVFMDEGFDRLFFIATSADKRGLVVERWCPLHAPTRFDYDTKASQKEDMSGKDAGTLTHREIAKIFYADLTEGDVPPVITPEVDTLTLVAAKAWDGEKKKGDYLFVPSKEIKAIKKTKKTPKPRKAGKTKPTYRVLLSGIKAIMQTKGGDKPKAVFCSDDHSQIFFLHEQGSNYLLENVRQVGYRQQRREATRKKADVSGKGKDIVMAMVPDLVVTSGPK
jgi:hypothetical protein